MDNLYRTYKTSHPSFSEDSRLMYVDGLCIEALEEHGVQKTEKDLHNVKEKTYWSWDIDLVIDRLASKGGLLTCESLGECSNYEDFRRGLLCTLFDVMINMD